jgi:vacuolar-type H+-ATPase subunit F/Vma7
MKRVAFITTGDAEYGFSLAGVIQLIAQEEEACNLLREAMARPEIGLIVLDERLMRAVTEEALHEIEREWHGILLVLPAPERPGVPAEDYVQRMIQRAIGYQVRLKV